MSSTTMVESSSSISTTPHQQQQMEVKKTSNMSSGVSFQELDIALKQVAKEETESMSVEVTLPRNSKNVPRRARSLSRNNTETLPDEVNLFPRKNTACL